VLTKGERVTAILAACAFFTAAAIALMSTTGLKSLVGVGYPMLGWICAIALGALAVFYEKRKRLPAPQK
jgi:uncharacterized membrane protein YkvI